MHVLKSNFSILFILCNYVWKYVFWSEVLGLVPGTTFWLGQVSTTQNFFIHKVNTSKLNLMNELEK